MKTAPKHYRLKYVGSRFTGTRLPLDVLSDLPAFRDLLVAFAKDAWLRENARRKRVPKGFEQSIVFDLIAIEDGSAVPTLEWDRSAAQKMLPGFSDSLETLVEESYLRLVGMIDQAGRGQFPSSLPADQIRALNKLGSGLKEDEKIEFPDAPRSNGPVYFDTRRRKELITRVKETYEVRFEGVGELMGELVRNASQGSITVNTSEHGPIEIGLDAETVRATFDGNIGAGVQFDILVELDHEDKFRSVRSVYQLDLVDEEVVAEFGRCRSRITEMRRLTEGWDAGDGSPVADVAIDNAMKFLEKRPSLSPIFRIFPVPDGGLAFEFESDGWDYTVEFRPSGEIEFYGVEIGGTKELQSKSFDKLDGNFLGEFDSRVSR